MGYDHLFLKVFCDDSQEREALLYMASSSNPFFIENESLEETAKVIATAKGQSGTNLEYFTNIVSALRKRDIYVDYFESLMTLIAQRS